VLQIIHESEGVVALGAPLIEIADPRSLEAAYRRAVAGSDQSRSRAGGSSRAWPEGPRLAARVRKVEPAAFTKVSALGIEEQRVNVILEFVEPLERVRTIGDGFRVNAQIVTFHAQTKIKVPVAALFRNGYAMVRVCRRRGSCQTASGDRDPPQCHGGGNRSTPRCRCPKRSCIRAKHCATVPESSSPSGVGDSGRP
jgi:hypothetical protein